MADIKKIKIGDVTYDIRDNRVITLTDGGSKTAGTWVANTGSPTQNLTAYPDGQLFLYKVTVAGASTTTLNIDGLGAKTIYRGGSSKLTTHYGVGSYVLLYYSSSLNDGSFIVVNDYASDSDSKTSSGDTSSKIFLVGATTQSTSGQKTYSHDTVYVGTDGHLYDSGKQVEVKGHGHANAVSTEDGSGGKDGFMSKEDKAHHDKMWNAWSADGTDETLVNKVEEVLTVFENFPEADNLVEVLSKKSKVGHTHGVSTQNAAPSGHTHTVTVSGTTGNNSGSAVKAVTGYASFSGGSGKLEAYDAATSGTKKVSNGTRIPVVTSVTHSPASLTGDKTFVKAQGTFSAGTTPVKSATFVGTEVTSGANSGTAVNALTGVKASSTDTFVKNINVGSGSLDFYADSTTTTAESKTNNRIPFVASISSTKASASGTAKAGSETHTHNYDKTTGVSLTANTSTATGRITYVESISGGSGSLTTDTTSTNGIKYVESISSTGASASGTAKAGSETHTHTYDKASLSGSNSSHTVKYMKFSAGTTPKSGATPVHTSTNSGANSGTAVTALTGVKVTAQPTIGLTANAATATGRITYVESISGGSGSLTSDTTSTNGIKYVEAQGTFSAGTTPPKSASFSGTAATITPTLTGKIISGTSCLELSITGASYTPAGSVTLTAGTAPSMGAATTKYLHHTHTAASATTKYLSASASGTAVGANGTASVAPSGHTHTYDKTTSITLTAGTAPSMSFDTKTNTDTPYVASATNSSLALSHTSTASGGPSATTTFVTGVTGGTASATTKYLHHSHSAASATTKYLSAAPSNTSTASGAPSATTSFVTGVSGGTTTATTKYLDHIHNTPSVSSSAKAVTAVAANGTASVAPSSHTHPVTAAGAVELTRGTAPSLGAATTGTVGISGGSITPTTYYLEHGHTGASLGTASTANAAPHTHTHGYGSSTALTTTANSGTAVAAVTAVKASTN